MATGVMRALFPVGSRHMTAAVAAEAQADHGFAFEVALAFTRHESCDWREMSNEDAAANYRAIYDGSRIFSAFTSRAGRLFIITEADRSSTTVMFAREY